MQERTKPVFVIATANDISRLPPEFMRKGRFDEIFFIDLPTRAERIDIFRLHLNSRLADGPDLGDFDVADTLLAELADDTEGFTGSEIEQAVVSACFDAFDGRRHLTTDDLRHAISTTVPLSVTQAEDIAALRAWASLRAVSASTIADRTGYTVVPPAAEPTPDPAAALQRGGRQVEV
jgi:SpoVK/Ycf46/Vps4 family AAA+-type ATPase